MLQWWHYLIIIISILLIVMVVLSFREARKASVRLSPEDFKQQMRKGQLIDVRSREEFNKGHINGARNIHVSQIPREYKKLRSDLPIYLYCSTGKRSNRAAVYLTARGFTQIYQLDNGLQSWNEPLKSKK